MKNYLIYLSKVLLLYLLFYGIYLFLFAMTDPDGRLHYPTWLLWADPIHWLRAAIIHPSLWLINGVIGIKAVHVNNMSIWVPQVITVNIAAPCLGVMMMGTWASLVLPFEKKEGKLLFLFIGLFAIYMLNILRVVGIVYSFYLKKEWAYQSHDLLNYAVYSTLLLLFCIWVFVYKKEK